MTDLAEIKVAVREILKEEYGLVGDVPLADKWRGGTMVLKPKDPQKQDKVIPLQSFFHKIVMVRDRLRVLEQKVNANNVLTDADKVELQQYVTRCYGSLTSFNVLFADDKDRFSGTGGGAG